MRTLALVFALAFIPTLVMGQTWPDRPVRVIVPYAPGGTVDTVSRYLAERLSVDLEGTFIVENRPGAGGSIGTEAVTRASADGYTLLIAGNPTHSLNRHLYRLTYDPLEDLTNIALIGMAPNLLVVNPDTPVSSIAELVEYAASRPGDVTFSSAGSGTTGHLAGELLGREAGIDIRHIPYKGQADAITAVMRGDVNFAFVTIPGTLAHVEAGNLNAIAITSAERSPLAPAVPTVVEAGYPDFVVLAWYNLSAPKGLPSDIRATLEERLAAIMQSAALEERFEKLGLEARYLTGEQYADFLQDENQLWGSVIREAGLGQ